MEAGLIKGVLIVPNVFSFWALANAHDLTLDVIRAIHQKRSIDVNDFHGAKETGGFLDQWSKPSHRRAP